MSFRSFFIFSISTFIFVAQNVSANDAWLNKAFPDYPKRPDLRTGPVKPSPFQTSPDPVGNNVTEDHLRRREFANSKMKELMKDMRYVGPVNLGREQFSQTYRRNFEYKRPHFDRYYEQYNRYQGTRYPYRTVWNKYHVYGGFHYGFRPELNIDTYFNNPVVYWLFSGNFDEPFYRSWYLTDYVSYPQFQRPFSYHGVFFPTENLRLLLLGVSGMSVQRQAEFRDAITLFTQKLAQNLADNLSRTVRLSTGDVTVTHYELVGYDDAVVMEGFVSVDDKTYDFKGLLDLHNANSTAVIAPVSIEKKPTREQIKTIEQLNKRISEIRGDDSSTVTATPASETEEAEAETGDIVAKPKKAK